MERSGWTGVIRKDIEIPFSTLNIKVNYMLVKNGKNLESLSKKAGKQPVKEYF